MDRHQGSGSRKPDATPGSATVQGASGCEITSTDVRAAYLHTLTAATNAGVRPEVQTRIRALFDNPVARSGFVASIIGKDVGLD